MENQLQLFSMVNFGYGENPKRERLRLLASGYDFVLALDKGDKDEKGKVSFTEAASVSLTQENIVTLKTNFIDQYLKLTRSKLWEIRKEGKPTNLHDVFISCKGDDKYKLYALRFITHCSFDQNGKMNTTTKFMIYGLAGGYDEYAEIRKSKDFPRDAVLGEYTLNSFGSADGEPYVPKATMLMEQFSSILEAIIAGTSNIYGNYIIEYGKSQAENKSSDKGSSKPYYSGNTAPAPDTSSEDEFPF